MLQSVISFDIPIEGKDHLLVLVRTASGDGSTRSVKAEGIHGGLPIHGGTMQRLEPCWRWSDERVGKTSR